MIEGNQHEAPQFLDRKNPILTFDDALKVATERRKLWQESKVYQESATVNIPTRDPIAIFGIGDVHFGSIYCDHERFLRDVAAIRNTPNAYMVFLSNLVDNAMPSQFPDSMLANSITPMDQAKGMNDLLKGLDADGKILGAVKSPCHEGWTWKKAGIDINELIYADRTYPLLENGGNLRIQMEGASYNLALYHQFGRFGSQFNKSHPVLQQQRMVQGGEMDAIFVGHSHVGEVLQTYFGHPPHRKPFVSLRTGSYKGNVSQEANGISDMWQRDQSGMDGEPGGQSLMLYGDAKRMNVFLDPITAAEHLSALQLRKRIELTGFPEVAHLKPY